MKISDIESITGVKAQTIRHWESERVITPERTGGGHRRYNKSHIEQILALKNSGGLRLMLKNFRFILTIDGEGKSLPINYGGKILTIPAKRIDLFYFLNERRKVSSVDAVILFSKSENADFPDKLLTPEISYIKIPGNIMSEYKVSSALITESEVIGSKFEDIDNKHRNNASNINCQDFKLSVPNWDFVGIKTGVCERMLWGHFKAYSISDDGLDLKDLFA